MKNSIYMTIVVTAVMLTGCSRVVADIQERAVMMSADVCGPDVVTKASGEVYTGEVPTADNPLAVDLWFSEESGKYGTETPGNTETYIPCHTKMTFDTGNPVAVLYEGDSGKALKYPTDGNIMCMGFYPQGVWTWSGTDGVVATAEIDGSDDLMFAPEITGNWNDKFGPQQYSHVLTWLEIVGCATSHDADDAWGKITKISVVSKSVVNISAADNSTAYAGDDISILALDDSEGRDLKVVFDNTETGVYGSVFVSPAESVTVTVLTSDGKTAEKTIAPAGGFMAGRQYVVALYFDPLAIIDGFCTLTSWENENDNLYIR